MVISHIAGEFPPHSQALRLRIHARPSSLTASPLENGCLSGVGYERPWVMQMLRPGTEITAEPRGPSTTGPRRFLSLAARPLESRKAAAVVAVPLFCAHVPLVFLGLFGQNRSSRGP